MKEIAEAVILAEELKQPQDDSEKTEIGTP